MRYVLPSVLFAALAAMVLLSPHVEPRRLRARAALLGERLRAERGFTPGSKAAWLTARSTGWPPFHYGSRQAVDGELVGTLDGLAVRVAGYECVYAGTRYRYGLAGFAVPRPVEWAEVRGETAFSAARVAEHVPDGPRTGPVPDFNRLYQLYAVEPQAVALVTSRETAQAMLDLPERFNWRCVDSEVLLWKRDGWRDAESLIASVRAVAGLVEAAASSDWLV